MIRSLIICVSIFWSVAAAAQSQEVTSEGKTTTNTTQEAATKAQRQAQQAFFNPENPKGTVTPEQAQAREVQIKEEQAATIEPRTNETPQN